MNEARAGQGRAGLFGADAKVELAEAQARSGLAGCYPVLHPAPWEPKVERCSGCDGTGSSRAAVAGPI